ncbi:hypothetical protein B296_00032401 [Ensete ventricosum]|uniref:Uncharacterized protein n=1 Tax=Ensete ventricosum TaxID=4639 RepID=A0A426ZY94_ENSVE|nr:hypothetical protein B296_00032401 [Ensete ventricosum]
MRITASATCGGVHGPRRRLLPLAPRRGLLGPNYFFTAGLRRAAASDLFGSLRLRSSPAAPALQEKCGRSPVVAMAGDGAFLPVSPFLLLACVAYCTFPVLKSLDCYESWRQCL